MILQELTVRLQALCHDGYSLSEVKVKVGGKVLDLNDVVFLLETEQLKTPIELKVDKE